MLKHHTKLGSAIFALGVLLACAGDSVIKKPKAEPRIPPPALEASEPVHFDHLHNVVAYGEGLYSGGVPEDETAFDTLRDMGISRIISVDGAKPDVEAARARGIEYIHLPIGYNGMTAERTLEIAKAVKSSDGPVYIHCHHGKHRSAGAAGAAAVTLGIMSNVEAEQRLKVSGTSPGYPGLYACVSNARPASRKDFAAVRDEFPEIWQTSGMVNMMVEIEHALAHLEKIEEAGWKTPADSPDLVPAAEAGLMADLFRNLQDDEDAKQHPAEFIEWALADSKKAEELETALIDGGVSHEKMSELLAELTQSCKDCHVKYRNEAI